MSEKSNDSKTPMIQYNDNSSDTEYENEIFLCDLCSFLCEKREQFENHLLLHEDKMGKTASYEIDETDIGNEIQDNNFENRIEVFTEELETDSQGDSNIEVENIFLLQEINCNICHLTFFRAEDLNEHKLVHENKIYENKMLKKPVSGTQRKNKSAKICEICNKVFQRNSNLNIHLTTHTKDLYCYVCCNSYITQFKLEHHMTEHTKEELLLRKEDPCTIECPFDCSKKFPSKLQLYEHKKRHNNVVDFACDKCIKKFTSLRQLNTHKKKHFENSNCNICGKHFSNSKTLEEHLRIHSGEKPFACSVCNMQFRCQSSLKMHETLHSEERKYKCGQCSKAFARSNYLKEHMRIHFFNKPFQCKFCFQTFTQANVLKTHVSKKHQNCPICAELVGDTMEVRVHIWRLHPEFDDQYGDTFVCVENDSELILEQTIDNTESIEDSVMKQFT